MIGARQVWLAWFAIAALGLTIGYQGWRSRGPDGDVASALVRASALIERGRIPTRGNLTDLNAFRPPGTSWLLAPGVTLFDDPRQAEMAATGMLFLAALAGVFVLSRDLFSTRAALFAAACYAVSAVPINLLGALQPRAYPAFVVWTTLFSIRWVRSGRPRLLVAALAIACAGAYVHLEMVPFAFVPLAIGIARRVRVPWGALAAAGVIAAVMWLPYLRFEAGRDFADVRAQLSLRAIAVRGPIAVEACGEDPLPEVAFLPRASTWLETAAVRTWSIPDFVLMNVQSRILAGDFLLLSLLAAGVVTGSAIGGPVRIARALPAVAAVMGVSIVTVEFALRWGSVSAAASERLLALRHLHVWAVVALSTAACFDSHVSALARRLRASWSHGDDTWLLALAIVVPSSVILVLSDPGETRMLGMWPLQAVMIAGVTDAAAGPARRLRTLLSWAIVFVVIAANLQVEHRFLNWRAHGWAGGDPERIPAAGFRDVRCEDER